MKEPLVADFLEQFLDQHNICEHSISSPNSNRSRASSPASSSLHRISHRLSQVELLDYSHHQQLVPSPRASFSLPLTPVENDSPIQDNHRPSLPRRMSRGASMPSLDAAMISM